jgi:DNA replicative helicase MCM subunit Mcm2 (Cdc46/Mcm family)
LSGLSLAMHQVILDNYNEKMETFKNSILQRNNTNQSTETNTFDELNSNDYLYDEWSSLGSHLIPVIKARLVNFGPTTKIKQLKSNMYNNFVSITGTVVKASNTKPFITRMAYECRSCSSTFV